MNKNVSIQFSNEDFDEIMDHMDEEKYETIQDMIMDAIRLLN